MKRIAPSETIRNEIMKALAEGLPQENSLSWLIEKSVQRILQEAIEQEVSDYLGRDRYSRKEDSQGHRNGYEEKTVKTAEGPISLKMPQVRNIDPFHSKILPEGEVVSDRLRHLAVEMYARGLSTRDIEEAFKANNGKPLISRTGVSEITESLAEEYDAFTKRDLSNFDLIYLFLDGVYEQCRYQAGNREAIFCAWGILSSGEKILLSLGMGNKESYDCWVSFLRDMIARGLRQPLLTTTDGAPGLMKAVNDCFPGTKRQRCLFHKVQNIVNKLPESAHREVLPKIKSVFEQTDKEIARLVVQKLINDYAQIYPAAMKCLQDDLEACLSFIEFPLGHHKAIRTTNLIERAFEEYRRRSKVIPRFMSEKSCLKLIFATLIRVSERWRRVKMTEFDLTLLKNIRHLYGWKETEGEFVSKKIA